MELKPPDVTDEEAAVNNAEIILNFYSALVEEARHAIHDHNWQLAAQVWAHLQEATDRLFGAVFNHLDDPQTYPKLTPEMLWESVTRLSRAMGPDGGQLVTELTLYMDCGSDTEAITQKMVDSLEHALEHDVIPIEERAQVKRKLKQLRAQLEEVDVASN